ncbi:MAG: hypothetical protein WA921_14270 [Ahrensia sp.]
MQNDDEGTNPANAGGAEETTGIAQTISTADIRATLISSQPVEDRMAALEGMKRELQARQSANRGGDIAPLIADIDNALQALRKDDPTASSDNADIKSY